MDKIQLIIINGLVFIITLPLLAIKFPRVFTLLRFTTPSPLDSIFEKEYRRIMSEKQEAELVVVEQETEVVVVEEKFDEKTTEKSIVDDTVGVLVSTGFKKREAVAAVNRVIKNKNFDNVQDLLIATLDRSNT